jgi:hypothetical protein
MALVVLDEKTNGRILAPKEGEATKLSVVTEEFVLLHTDKGVHIHMYCQEQKELFLWAKSGQEKAKLPGKVYWFLSADSAEAGVKVAVKLLQTIPSGVVYKGQITVDGSLGVAEQLLGNDDLLLSMKSLVLNVAEVTAPQYLKPEDAIEIEQPKGFKSFGSKAETTKERFSTRVTLLTELVADTNKLSELRLALSMYLDKEPSDAQKIDFLVGLLK